ncbi:MAG TPA: RNA polymerase sigma factor [Candidatus Hydrothermia bacterium]|nr:RNA polymerase sigma factor [Candidatus Hydrothermia bacterium]MDD5572300.1 RNA polymerase sigma factor [Candidatus Hydrothermia bacterium]HOK23443.1 RNA polymerase sigma factor [Candidatus Hydrothermia bacterium]HOL23961.1 RNA polymerase sigma factor [Candidatus Hydrothermia bacterium]HOP32719.1 RNA polymerase sigma factor [Candidatus Hydrothermia bacterium]
MGPKFEEVYNSTRDMIFNYVFWKVNDYDDAIDLTQEIFIKVYKNLGKFRGQSSVKTWIMSIAINHVNDFFRKKRKFDPVYFDDGEDAGDNSPSFDSTMDLDDEVRVERAMAKLKNWEREILTLYYMEGFQYEEIAELLKIPLGTVKSRLSGAKKSLRKIIMGGVLDGK